MIKIIGHMFAKNPPSILLMLGGVGLLFQMSGAAWLLALGTFLQVAWMGFRFRI